MSSAFEEITVECPRCGVWYDAWYRPSVNRMLEDFDDDYIERVSTTTCTVCGTDAYVGGMVVREDATMVIRPPTAFFRRKDVSGSQRAHALVLKSVPPERRRDLIRLVHRTAGISLAEAREVVGQLPAVIKSGMRLYEAEDLKAEFEQAGATVSISHS